MSALSQLCYVLSFIDDMVAETHRAGEFSVWLHGHHESVKTVFLTPGSELAVSCFPRNRELIHPLHSLFTTSTHTGKLTGRLALISQLVKKLINFSHLAPGCIISTANQTLRLLLNTKRFFQTADFLIITYSLSTVWPTGLFLLFFSFFPKRFIESLLCASHCYGIGNPAVKTAEEKR